MTDRSLLIRILTADLDRTPRDDVRRAAEDIAARHGATVAAVLFYGSGLRDDDPDAIIDLYVLVDDYRAFFPRRTPAVFNRLLPPNVLFLPSNGRNAGFKVAVISRRQFRDRLVPASRDTTLWARFCQPVAVAYSRDVEAREWVVAALADAAATAIHWAVRLGPDQGTAADYWAALFRHTYAAEMRVEGGGRAKTIADFAADRYAALIAASGELAAEPGGLRRTISTAEAHRARAAWARRRRIGKTLNIARLAKALFTFDGGIDYIVWKLERHSGQPVALTPWQRRHPLLAAPFVLASLRRRGIVR
jgi:hypothetical protein